MLEMYEPIIVEFPLRGQWLSPNTPGTKVPGHGTNQLGKRKLSNPHAFTVKFLSFFYHEIYNHLTGLISVHH